MENQLFSSYGPDSKVIKPAASGQNHGAKEAELSSIHLPELSEDLRGTRSQREIQCQARYTYL
jgi:hypothetical protein